MKRMTSIAEALTTGRVRAELDGVEVGLLTAEARTVLEATVDELELANSSTGWGPLPLLPGITGGAWIKRTGVWVELELRDIAVGTGGHVAVVNVPAGYRPPILSTNSTRSGVVVTDTGTARSASYYQDTMRILSAATADSYSGRLIWSTTDAWPTSPPA